jgi:hypothetical protein
MQLLAFREYPAIDAQTLVEFTGHERLFRGPDGSFLAAHVIGRSAGGRGARHLALCARRDIMAQ